LAARSFYRFFARFSAREFQTNWKKVHVDFFSKKVKRGGGGNKKIQAAVLVAFAFCKKKSSFGRAPCQKKTQFWSCKKKPQFWSGSLQNRAAVMVTLFLPKMPQFWSGSLHKKKRSFGQGQAPCEPPHPAVLVGLLAKQSRSFGQASCQKKSRGFGRVPAKRSAVFFGALNRPFRCFSAGGFQLKMPLTKN
jgi:hypothetical protein